jgi:6-phosphogluconolactonase/glucosamine-6-phosphate isomerase/deaminase
MKKRIFDDAARAALYIAATVEQLIEAKKDEGRPPVFCLAAGHTSLPVFDALVERKIDFSAARFIELDEWLDISPEQSGSCAGFMRENFFSRINADPRNISLFNPRPNDPGAECRRMQEILGQWGGIDYLLLGMGMNGHLALNEPGSGGSDVDDMGRGVHVSALSGATLAVAPKYFPQGMPPLTRGITLGLADIRAARLIHLAVFGSHKREAVRHLLEAAAGVENSAAAVNRYAAEFPAAALLDLAHAELLMDLQAAEAAD